MLIVVTAHDSGPFEDPREANPLDDQRPAVDVSQAAMSRLRTPFGVEDDDADRETGHHADRRQ